MSAYPARPPLFYALAQVQFNPIVEMKTYVPEIQDSLRRKGWPDYLPQKSHGFRVSQENGQEPEVTQEERERWLFNSPEKRQGFILQQNSLTFHSTDYRGFDELCGSLLKGLEVLDNVVDLQYLSSAGLRYLNSVDPALLGNAPLEELVEKSVLGLYGMHKENLRHVFSETVIDDPDGSIVSRSLVSRSGIIWPPDLQPLALNPDPDFEASGETVVILDNDFRSKFSAPKKCDLEYVSGRFEAFHDKIAQMFRELTTQKARDGWGIYE